MKKCPDCNSEKIIKNARAIDQNQNYAGDFCVAVDEHPDAIMFKQRASSGVYADICGECGFIQFYAYNPGMLWAAYQNQLKNVS